MQLLPDPFGDVNACLQHALQRGDVASAIAQSTIHGVSDGQWCWAFERHGPDILDQLHAGQRLPIDDAAWLARSSSFAIFSDNAEALAWLIDKGHPPGACVDPGLQWTSMAWAAKWVSVRCLGVLATAGAPPLALDRTGHGLLHMLAATPRKDASREIIDTAIQRLLSMGLDINLRSGICADTPAATAAFHHNLPMLLTLAANGADLGARNSSGYDLVHAACQGSPDPGSGEVIDYLLSSGMATGTGAGTHPTHFAAARNNPHALRALARHGMSLEVPLCDDQAQTPVYTAMCAASTDALEFLVASGARCDVMDRRGCGLLHLACGRHRISGPGMLRAMRDLVVNRGMDPDMPSNLRQTPLLHAAHEGSVSAMQAMLDLGASPTAVCLEARNLLHYAAQQAEPGPAHLAVKVTPPEYRNQPDAHGALPHELAYSLGHDEVGHILEAAWSSTGLCRQTPPSTIMDFPRQRI